jgi:hypothetical protein
MTADSLGGSASAATPLTGFTLSDAIMIAAVLLAPLVALRVSAWLEDRKEKRLRKGWIFRTLIATRAANLSERHVEALNLIDIDFYDSESVRNAWKIYIDHLSDRNFPAEQWAERRVQLLSELLLAMSKHLGYKFDIVHLKRAVYAPQGHGDRESELDVIRRGLAEVLMHQRTLPVELTSLPTEQAEIEEQSVMKGAFKGLIVGEKSLKVSIVDPTPSLQPRGTGAPTGGESDGGMPPNAH